MKVFSRSKFVSCYKTSENTLETRSSLVDSVHEMEVVIVTDMKKNEIISARSEIIRAPYKICREISQSAVRLAGLKLDQNIGKNTRSIMGGAGGCFQLEDLSLEAVKAIKQCNSDFMPGDLSEIIKAYDSLLRGTCYSHCRPVEEKAKEYISPNFVSKNQ